MSTYLIILLTIVLYFDYNWIKFRGFDMNITFSDEEINQFPVRRSLRAPSLLSSQAPPPFSPEKSSTGGVEANGGPSRPPLSGGRRWTSRKDGRGGSSISSGASSSFFGWFFFIFKTRIRECIFYLFSNSYSLLKAVVFE